jgi:hypothetical protein
VFDLDIIITGKALYEERWQFSVHASVSDFTSDFSS